MENKIEQNEQKTFLMILKEMFNKILNQNRLLCFAILLSVILAFIFLLIWINHDRYSVLFSNLSQNDSSAIVEQLMLEDIPCKLTDNNTRIKIKNSYLDEWRLRFASQGLPNDGSADNKKYGSKWIDDSQYKHKLSYLHTIQTEFARTISWIDAVDRVRIHMVDANFNKEGKSSSASVALKLKKGRTLSSEQLLAIANLISSGVNGLSPKDVTIVDTTGKLLSANHWEQFTKDMTNTDLVYKKDLEDNLEKRVQNMLEIILGQGKVIVKITAEISVNQQDKTGKSLAREGGGQPVLEKLFTAVIIDDRHDKNHDLKNKTVLLDEKRIADIEGLIKNAIGFNAERGDRINVTKMPFASQGELFEEPTRLSLILSFIQLNQQIILNIIVILLFFFMIIIPAMRWLKRIKNESVIQAAQTEFGDNDDLRNKTKITAEENLDKAVEIIRIMMKGK